MFAIILIFKLNMNNTRRTQYSRHIGLKHLKYLWIRNENAVFFLNLCKRNNNSALFIKLEAL